MQKSITRVADLRQQAYEALKARITSGGFPVDTRFHEIALAQELGVSRTPVREALAMLVRDGLLIQATRGFAFPRFSPQDITESIEIRLLLEPYAIRRMVEDNPPDAMRALGQRMQHILEHTADKAPRYLEAHRAARAAMYEHMRNGQLVETLRRFEDRVHYMRLATLNDPAIRGISHAGMMTLAEAVGDADSDRAQAQMRRQLMNALQAFLDICTREADPPDMPELQGA